MVRIVTDKSEYYVGETIKWTASELTVGATYIVGAMKEDGTFYYDSSRDKFTASSSSKSGSYYVGSNIVGCKYFAITDQNFMLLAYTSISIVEKPQLEEAAEIDVYFIRLPYVSDDYIKDGLKTICNTAFQVAGHPQLSVGDIRLQQVNWAFWKASVDVMKPVGDPVPWALIAGIIIGAVLAGVIMYYVEIKPREENAAEATKKIEDVIAEVEKAKSEGKVDPDTASKIESMLKEAEQKAGGAGAPEDWTKWIQPMMQMLPALLMVAVVIAVLGVMQRARD